MLGRPAQPVARPDSARNLTPNARMPRLALQWSPRHDVMPGGALEPVSRVLGKVLRGLGAISPG